jgi:DNA-directed RNA polymerase subunit K/omega
MVAGEEAATKAIERFKNRYLLVNVVAKRVKSMKKLPTFSEVEEDGVLIDTALREIAEGKIRIKDIPDPSSAGGDDGDESRDR